MKLRIHGNRVRVRLTQPEVARVAEGHGVEQTTTLSPTASLSSAVQLSPTAKTVEVTFVAHRLTIWLPAEQAKQWAASDEVGIETFTDVGGGQTLKILVEKDFQCLHKDDETVDAFPNPRA